MRDLPDNYVRGDNNVDTYEALVTVLITNNSWVNRANAAVTLPLGILRHISINFPAGCNNKIFAVIYQGAGQVYPVGAAGAPYYTGNNLIIDLDVFKVVSPTTTAYTVYAWNDGTSGIYWTHIPVVRFIVEKVVVP